MSSAVHPAAPAGSRSRPQARRKPNDDATYFGPPLAGGAVSGTKRLAVEKADGDHRAKRKRVDASAANAAMAARKTDRDRDRERERTTGEVDLKCSMVDFNKMPMAVLYRYLTQFDLVPHISPSPLTAEDPPPPSSLDNPFRQQSRAPSPPPLTTPANRPRRESKDQTRRRSSRLVEEDPQSRTPVLADIEELHGVLAGIAERHFREQPSINGREEVDTLASFMCAVEKAKSK